MVPLQLYTPQIQNGATPPLYPTNPERRHTTAIPHVQEQDLLPPSVHERAFLTPPQGANLCLNLLNSLYLLNSFNSLESFKSLNSLNSLDSLNLPNSLNSIHLIHFQFTYLT